MEVRRSIFGFFFNKFYFVLQGQWDMVVNLINKYGVVPKTAFPESSSSESALYMNKLLRTKVCLQKTIVNNSISFSFLFYFS